MRWTGTLAAVLTLLVAANGGPSDGKSGRPSEGKDAGAYREVEVVRAAVGKKGHGERKIANAHLAWPDLWFEPHRINGLPRTHPRVKKAGRVISSIATRVRALGAEPRLCIDFRPDAYRRREGTHDTATGLGAFDDSWIARVPVAAHNAAVGAYDQTRVGPVADLQWANELSDARCQGFDRARKGVRLDSPYAGTRSDGTCPLFYASAVRAGKPAIFQWGGFFVTDMRIQAARRWLARNLADRIADTGATCALVAYKPGWHAYNDTGSHASECWQPGDRNWNGIARPTPECRSKGLLTHAPYGPGEFRAALNDFLSRALALAESSPGVCDWHVVTIERDDYADRRWALLDDAVRSHPCLLGEWASDRRL